MKLRELPRKPLTLKSEHPAFELNVPAKTAKTVDIPWAAGASSVIAQINPMEDTAMSWGLGCAVSWNEETYLQVNARADGRWNMVQNGVESQIQGCVKGLNSTRSLFIYDEPSIRENLN
jgi:hypothetical protein